jgi:hypothetical protein
MHAAVMSASGSGPGGSDGAGSVAGGRAGRNWQEAEAAATAVALSPARPLRFLV